LHQLWQLLLVAKLKLLLLHQHLLLLLPPSSCCARLMLKNARRLPAEAAKDAALPAR
jgi:hypothetical protein